MIINAAKSIYPKEAVLKAAYQFTDVAYLFLEQTDSDYVIHFTPKEGEDPVTEGEFRNELLAQSVRHGLFLQTKELRNMIAMRAMASTIIGEQEELPAPAETLAESQILRDWFANDDSEI